MQRGNHNEDQLRPPQTVAALVPMDHSRAISYLGGQVKYTIISAQYPQNLVDKVSQYLMLGWVPQGGISVTTGVNGSQSYYQAMTLVDLMIPRHDRQQSFEVSCSGRT